MRHPVYGKPALISYIVATENKCVETVNKARAMLQAIEMAEQS